MKKVFLTILSHFGYTLVKKRQYFKYKKSFKHYQRHQNLMDRLDFDVILDVGAHEGGFASEMLDNGYKGVILSFEPITKSFDILLSRSEKMKNWKVFKQGLGDKSGQFEINVSENYVSSSFLEMSDIHLSAANDSINLRKELVEVVTIDEVIVRENINTGNCLLKLDTQGFEKQILIGANNSLTSIKAIKLELSLQELYTDSDNFIKISDYLYQNGFVLISIENGFYDRETNVLLQFDGLFLNRKWL